jgi:hypothetical protein
MIQSNSEYMYYGRLFFEKYREAGGLIETDSITELTELVKSAAQAAAKPESRDCCCEFYATNYRFVGMVLKFKCPVHGTFAVNSVPAVATTPYVSTVPPISIPYWPYQPPINPCPNGTGDPLPPNETICACTRPDFSKADDDNWYDRGPGCYTGTRPEVANGKCWPREPEGFIAGNGGSCC